MRVLHSRFSPQHLDPAVLERRMVGRDDDAHALIDGVVETLSHGGARYELIVAPRGLGKTHLLTVVGSRLRRHPVVLERAVLLSLDEEEHVSGLLDLFRRVLRAMPPVAGLPDAPTLAAGIRLPTEGDGVDPVVGMIRARLGDRALVLLLENFDRLLAALSDQERWRLRGVLEAEARFSIIATAQRLPPTLTGRKEAFYHKFHRFPLRPLTAEECGSLLHDLSVDSGKLDLAQALETPEGRGRVRSIHHLLGGTPRAMALLFPYLTVDTLRSLEDAFYPLGDELTPYIQEQWRNRAPGEQAVLEALAQSWRPLTVTEISTSTLSAPSSVSKQLQRLSADELVQVVSVGKERFYSIGDPLARIGRAMKSTEEAPRVFIRFLRHWHTQGELSAHLTDELDPLKRDVWQSALASKPEVAEERTIRPLVDTLLASAAGNHRPWARLAPPERELVIELLNGAGERGLAIAATLPPVE